MSRSEDIIRVLTSEGSREVSSAELPEVLPSLGESTGPVTWIHADLRASIVQALDDIGLDEIAVKSLRDGPERPRVEEFADHLYISLFSAEQRPRQVDDPVVDSTEEEARTAGSRGSRAAGEPGKTAGELPRLSELRLFLGQRWVISVGHLNDSDYEILAERMRRQVFSRKRGPSFVAYHICEWLVESLQPAMERLDDRIDALEDEVVLATAGAPMQELFALKRDLVDLRRRVAPLRDVMQRLGSHGVLYVEPEAEVYFRDVHDDIMRVIELLDTYRDILSSALDLHLSSVSNRLNRVMKQLTVVATVFMPLSFIVGLFGTNFADMPFGSTAWFVVMFALLFVSVVIMLTYTRRRT